MALHLKRRPAKLTCQVSSSTINSDSYSFISCFSPQDLGSSDLRKDVYIVVHIVRIGRTLFYFC